MRKITVLVLLLCCIFLSAAEKVVIQRSADSDIQSIVAEDDFLIIRSKGNIYTFKLSELLKDKTLQATRSVPKTLQEAFKYNRKWFFFNKISSKRNRLCYLNNKKKSYKVFKQGDLLERVLYKNKYYARDLDKNIFRPDWEIKKDFSPHFIPATQYLEALDDAIRSLQMKIKLLELKIPMALSLFETTRRRYNAFLTVNNITIVKRDRKGNITTIESNGKYSRKIKKELTILYENLKKEEEEFKRLTESFSSSFDKLEKLFELKKKLDASYRKYVLKQNVTIPIKICF
jgi:hypothetical protein